MTIIFIVVKKTSTTNPFQSNKKMWKQMCDLSRKDYLNNYHFLLHHIMREIKIQVNLFIVRSMLSLNATHYVKSHVFFSFQQKFLWLIRLFESSVSHPVSNEFSLLFGARTSRNYDNYHNKMLKTIKCRSIIN